MHRFFVSSDQIKDKEIYITGEDVNHIRDVLRCRPGEKIEVVCSGTVYLSEIIDIGNKKISLKILNTRKGENEPDIKIYLYQGLPKSKKMDFIIQKAVEIGVGKIYPIITERTVVRINNKKKEKKRLTRWSKIATEAAKQSKRDKLPELGNILKFEEMIKLLEGEKNIIIPYEVEEKEQLKKTLENIDGGKIHLIIGPEGGFEEEEIDKLKNIGGKTVSLGPRILRTETAGIVAMSILMYELGDMR